MLRNEKGFTLIEIIAVLVILGILAAVAIPKYISMMDESRRAAAQGAIAEMKARATASYAKLMMSSGQTPDGGNVLALVQGNTDLGSDFQGVLVGQVNTNDIKITIGTVRSTALTTAVTGTWFYPTT